MSHERPRLRNARETLKLTRESAGQLINPPISHMAVYRLEHGSAATLALRKLCRGYMRHARELGYDAWEYHESVLCPREFPEPVRQDDAELDRILGGRGEVQGSRDEGSREPENNQANPNFLDNTGGGAAPSPADPLKVGK